MSANAPIAALTNVTKTFGTFTAVRNVTLQLEAGTINVLLGPNGAGKSTLLRLLAGLASPTQGSLTLFGKPATESRSRIAYMAHAPMLYDELSGMENLLYFAELHRTGASCACVGSPEMAMRAVNLDPTLPRPVSQYSQGMRQRLSLARALQSDPELLLLDEPFSNLDVASVQQMIDLLADFRTWPSPVPRTVVLTTHQAHLAAPIADRTLTIDRGTLQAENRVPHPREARVGSHESA